MKKKKILYAITKSSWGGAQRYVYDLATNLPKNTYEVAVALGGDGPLVSRLQAAGVRTVAVNSFTRDVSLFRDLRAFHELFLLFRAETPDVVHLNSAKAVSIGALAARIAGVPHIVATIHGSASGETWRPWWQRALIRSIERVSRTLATETIVVSVRDQERGTTLVQNGIGSINFKTKEAARGTLGLPDDRLVIGTIGELTKNKNHTLLIEAVGACAPTHITLVIIGAGEMEAELKARAQAFPSHDIRFLGYQENASQYLRAFDIFVLPSRKEGLPYVLLEAGLAALPVVATNVGGVSEIIEDAQTGIIVPSEDILALGQALTTLVEHESLRATYGHALEEKINREFPLEKMIADTVALY